MTIGSKEYFIQVFQKDLILAREATKNPYDLDESYPLTEEILNGF